MEQEVPPSISEPSRTQQMEQGDEEKQEMEQGGEEKQGTKTARDLKMERLLKHMDWRKAHGNHLGKVEDQKTCNCCTALVAVALVESQYNIYAAVNNSKLPEGSLDRIPLIELASQQLIDCYDKKKKECYTSSINRGLDWIKTNGICSVTDYGGFEAKKQDCKDIPAKYQGLIDKITKITPNTNLNKVDMFLDVEKRVIEEVFISPVGAGMFVYQSFRDWKSFDIYYPEEGESVRLVEIEGKKVPCRHAVMVVGYGTTEENENYWIIKNTWGESWGDKGYARIRRSSSVLSSTSSGYDEDLPLMHDFIFPELKITREKRDKWRVEREKKKNLI